MKKKELKKRIKDLEYRMDAIFDMCLNIINHRDAEKNAEIERVWNSQSKTEPIKRDEPAFTPQVFKFYNKGGVLTESTQIPEYVCTSEHYRFGDNAIMTFKERDCYHMAKYGCKQCEVSGTPVLDTVISVGKTEGPESESELKENEISLEVGKKYMTKNHEMVNCEAHVGDGVYQCKIAAGPLFYEANGTLKGNYPEWSITSEVKE